MNTKRAGAICGNPLNGLCERVCIEVNKVFDGCISKYSDVSFTVTPSDFSAGATPPYTFNSARSSGPSVISNFVSTPVDNRRSRIEMDVTFPITVFFTDANGNSGTASSSITMHRDIILRLPEDSVVPYTVTAYTNLVSQIGSFTSDNTVTFRCCIIQIIKVIVPVDILVPSYGYAEYPECTDYEGEICQGLLNTPIFPV